MVCVLTLSFRFSCGDAVDVAGEYDEDHYVVKIESGYGLIEKQLLRMSGEEAYEVWTGYACGGAPMYDNYQLTGEAVRSRNLNTQVEVPEELKCCYVVSVNDTIGCMAKDQVGTNRYTTGGGGGGGDWTPPAM